MKALVIAEKPSVARDIARVLKCGKKINGAIEGERQLKEQNPEKTFYYPDKLPVCPNMKKNTLEKVLHVLQTGENEVHVDAKLRENSKKPLEKMLELAAK